MPEPFRVEPIWPGRRAVIIGAGPSLTLKQIMHVGIARAEDRCRVVAVNNAVFVAWYADWLHGSDFKWWDWNKQSATRFPGIRTTASPTVPRSWAGWLQSTGLEGFDPDPTKIRTGSNGVYQAMHCMIHAGVEEIILLGVDMQLDAKGRSHFHGGHPDGIVCDHAVTMIPKFATLLPALAERGVRVVNATPGSALRTFPFIDLEGIL